MKIYLGADHNGYHLKEKIEAYLKKHGYDVVDEGDERLDPEDDFTVFASRVVNAMKAESDDSSKVRGILICGSGQGMAIAANRHKGIRAGLGWGVEAARSTRQDEDSNVLAIPSELLDTDKEWQDVINAWLKTPFANAARYKRRNAQLDNI
jgi:ribose 5-phosphate isomerase B